MKKKIIVALILFTALCQAAVASGREDSIKAAINRLSTAFEIGNAKIVKDDFSKHFSISTASYPQAVTHYLDPLVRDGALKKIEYISVDTQEGISYANVTYTQKNGSLVEGKIAFDGDNKFLHADKFDLFFGANRHAKSELVGKIPFTQTGNSIILSLKINSSEKPLQFLFDTGASGIAVNPTVAENIGLVVSQTGQASVVGGMVETSQAVNNTIHLSEKASLTNQKLDIIKGLPEKYDGIIGLGIAKKYIVNISFEKKEIELYTMGDYKFPDKGHNIEITVPEGVIEIPGILNIVGKKDAPGNFIFDTGANYHLIAFEKYVRKNRMLLTGFKPEGTISTVSMGVSSPTYYGTATQFRFSDDIVFNNMPVSLQASSGRTATDDSVPDGSIGINLISQFNVTIDLLRKIIHLEPLK